MFSISFFLLKFNFWIGIVKYWQNFVFNSDGEEKTGHKVVKDTFER